MAKKPKQFSLEDFQFIGDHVLIKAIKKESSTGLVSPKNADDKPEYGEVISCGDAVDKFKVGDIITFGKYVSEQTRDNGETYYFVRLEDIRGYLKK